MHRWLRAGVALLLAACAGGSNGVGASAGTALPPPNYAMRSAWLALPGDGSAMNAVPPRSGLSNLQRSAPADVFYVLPTTATGNATLQPNQAYDDPVANAFGVQVGRNQATAFNASGRIYAPFYRAIKNELWGADLSLVQKPLDLAYADVKHAFDYYMRHFNHGRPIIFASHSQGDVMLYRLLLDEFDGKPLAKRLVAAYIVGQPLDARFFDDYRTLRACDAATQTGCIIGWCTFGAGTTAKQVRQWAYDQYYWIPKAHRWGAPVPPFYPSDNPLTWSRSNATAPRDANAGSLPAHLFYPAPPSPQLEPLIAGAVSARSSPAATYVAPAPIPASKFSIAIEGVPFTSKEPPFIYHYFDFNLFWMNIRVNARDRLNAYLARSGARYPLIVSPTRATGVRGTPFTFTVRARGGATAFSASGLPRGLSIDAATGRISGMPATAGTSAAVVTASNANGSSNGELAIEVRPKVR